jgi:bacterial/archaeal transporter family protein
LGYLKLNHLWLIYALLSALTAALVSVFGKIGLQHVDANTATAIRAVLMAVFLIVVVVAQGRYEQISVILSDKKAIGFIILSGIAGALSWLCYFLALKYGKVSQVAPVDKFSVVIATLLAIIFLGEKLSLFNKIGVALITLGVIFVAIG